MWIRTLERSDIRDGFSSGDLGLDRFLRQYAWQNQRRHNLGVTYVAVDDQSRRVVGYFTVAAASVCGDTVDGSVATGGYEWVPVLRVARLAVDERVRGMGVGSSLLYAALRIALDESQRIGCAGVLVDALPEVVGFYERHGFQRLDTVMGGGAVRPRLAQMFLGVGTIRQAAEES